MKKIIIGENIVKSFGEGDEQRNVLDGVSAEINEGEFVAVMGPSCSGKSTLMFALSGIDGVDDGKVVFDGKDLSAVGENVLSDISRTKMGFIFQPDYAKKSEYPRQHHSSVNARQRKKHRKNFGEGESAYEKGRYCGA